MRQCIVALSLVVLVSGCAVAPTHDSQVATSLAAAGQGNVNEAIRELDVKTKDKGELLFNLEKGELLRIDARYTESQTAFEE